MARNSTLANRRKSSGARSSATVEANATGLFLQHLMTKWYVHVEDWEALPAADRRALAACTDREELLERFVHLGLLTEHVATRISAGKTFGLVLGNYRILDRIGSGGMGIVFKGEHVRLRRPVAIKVMPIYLSRDQSQRLLMRFYAEVRAIAKMNHPNVVRVLDTGEESSTEPSDPVLHYYVMDYLEGTDLERIVEEKGPIPCEEACDYVYQIADALVEADQLHLVHRDIKPSNILITPERQAMLLDFGLVRVFHRRVTEPGTLIGTVDFMAPEQAQDASSVDIRADIYGLGATLFWCLTGRAPFLPKGNIAQDLAARFTQPPPSAMAYSDQVSRALDDVIKRMLACNPDDRYPTPRAVLHALLPFIRPRTQQEILLPSNGDPAQLAQFLKHRPAGEPAAEVRQKRILLVDDEACIRQFCRLALKSEPLEVDEATDGSQALAAAASKHYDLVLLDLTMPGRDGLQVCQQFRQHPPSPNLKIIMLSGAANRDTLAQTLLAGADDYIAKPFTPLQLVARVKTALRLKDAQDRSDLLTQKLLAINGQLEQNLTARASDLVHARNALILALAELVNQRDPEASSSHLLRIQRYVRCLSEEAASMPVFQSQIDPNFVNLLECCAPLKDIGKVGLPDHILFKPGRLEADERIIMQSHTIIGADTLAKVAKRHGGAVAFLQMAIDVTRHHHERHDGKGYPDRLADSQIPLVARIVSIADVYDALRSRRLYRPGLSHHAAVQVMTEASTGHFDPVLLQAFGKCAADFERIYKDCVD